MSIRIISIIEKQWIAILSIVILSFILYGNTIQHDFNLDDSYILDNISNNAKLFEPFTQNFDRVDYRPVPMTSFNLQRIIEGKIETSTSHLINIILYIFCGIIFYYLLLALFKNQNNKYLLAYCIVLVFIAHPIHSNVVSSIKNRDILFSFIFSFSALYLFVKYCNSSNFIYLILCPIFILLGLLSKLDAVWVIMTIPIYYASVHGKFSKKLVLKTIAIALLSISILFIRFSIAQKFADAYVDLDPILYTENPMIGTGFAGKLFYSMVSFFYYIKFLIIPFGYYFYFGFQTIPTIHFLHPYFIAGSVFFVFFCYYLFRSFKQNKIVFIQLIMFATGILFFVNLLKPLAGVVAPRLIFNASAPFCVLIVLGIYKSTQTNFFNELFIRIKQPSAKTLILVGALVLFYTPFTITRNMDWKNHITLMDADIPNLRYSFQANRIASANYLRLAENPANFNTNEERLAIVRKGLTASKNAAKIDPESIYTQEGIGIAERILGNNKKAIEQFKFVIEKFDTSEVAWDFSGDIFRENNNLEAAIFHYKNAIRVSPLNLELYKKLNRTAIEANAIEDALQFYHVMANDNPSWYLPYENLGYLNLYSKDSLNAALQFKNCFERGKKVESMYNLLSQYLRTNNYTEELAIFQSAYHK